jgi:hypothetical protein
VRAAQPGQHGTIASCMKLHEATPAGALCQAQAMVGLYIYVCVCCWWGSCVLTLCVF